jgi:hypothetical protein
MKNGLIDTIVQSFPHRCPYCDQLVSYDSFDLKEGENRIQCPSCKRAFIKIVSGHIKTGESD